MNPAQAIEALRQGGMTEQVIAAAVGVNQSTVNRIRNGGSPGWQVGSVLVAMATAIQSERNPKNKSA